MVIFPAFQVDCSGQGKSLVHVQPQRSVGFDVSIEERSQPPIIFFGQAFHPDLLFQNLLYHERVNVLSRDFVGTEKTDVFDHVGNN